MNRLKLLAAAGFTLLALSACTEDKNLASKDPATAAKNIAVAFRENDFNRLSHISVPPDVYAKMEAREKDEVAKKPAPTADESKNFTDTLNKFTAPDAEDKLFTQVQPMLAQYGPQIPAFAAMGSGGVSQAINGSDKLSADEKTQANAMLTAIVKWTGTAHLDDPEKAKQAIKIVVTTARDLNLTTLEAAQKLSLSDKLQKVGIAVGGLRKALAVYGLDSDKALDSVTTTKKSEDGDNAVVTVSFTLLDTPIKMDVPMVKVDGRWYTKNAIDMANDGLNKPTDTAAPPVAGPAPEAAPAAPAAAEPSAEAPAATEAPARAEAPASPEAPAPASSGG